MMECEDFIQKFHSLEGVTLREKKKSLFCLLNSITALPFNTVDAIIQKLTPCTYLEETFKIELLIHFKKTNDLLQILTKGEEVGSYKIVREDWFIKEIMNEYTPAQFIEQIVPRLSFSVCSKIFRRIFVNVKSENVREEFFEGILNSYGISSALIFLPGCSDEKIEESFKKYSITFTVSQLKLLFQKNKDLIIKYFEQLIENSLDVDRYKWRPFFLYMGKQNPLFYFEICEKFEIDKIKLGRQSTKKFISAKKEQIVLKPHDYCRVLRKDVLVRKLGTDFPKFYKNLLPENFNEFRFCSAKSIIKYYPKKKQYELYYNAFAEVYKLSLWDHIESMDQKLIEFIPEKEEREKWVLKFENRQNIKKYLIKKKKCAMHFIEDDHQNIIRDKKTIFNTLITSCKVTQNYDAFLNILKSFLDRHRNSDVIIIYNFLRTIYKELDLAKFKGEHWQYIYDIIAIQLFKKQQIFHPIFLEYIKFQYLNKNPIEEFVLTLLNEAPMDLSKFNYNNKDFEKNLLLLFLKFLPKITNKKNEIIIQITLSIIRWNSKYPLESICLSNQKDIQSAIKEISSEKVNKTLIKVCRYLICTQKENQMSPDLDEMYWSNYEKLNDNTITNWYVKYKPLVLKDQINRIEAILKNKNNSFIRKLKKYSHLGIPGAISTSCLQELKISKPSKCGRIVKILVHFMEKSDFLSLMQQHIPDSDESVGDINDESSLKALTIQRALVKYSKLCPNMTVLLPTLLKYCRRNILSSCLPALYSSFHRVPENQLYSALQQLENASVTVRKHTIFLTSLILPIEKVLCKYKEIQSTEKNFSVKQHMFMNCYKYFLRNELPECWTIIENYLQQMKKGDKESLKMITNVHLIPRKYRAAYTEMAWNVLEKFKTKNASIDDNMFVLLNNLKKNDIILLNTKFCCNIIENKLFDDEECSFDNSVSDFCRQFFLFNEFSEDKMKSLSALIHRLKKQSVHSFEKQREILSILHDFCFKLLADIISSDDIENVDAMLPKNFNDILGKLFSVEEIFEEKFLLDLITFKIESNTFKQSLPGQMSKLFTNLKKDYGHLIMKRFNTLLGKVLNILYPDDDFGVLQFLNTFLKEQSSLDHCALVIELMPFISYFSDKQTENEYHKLLKYLYQYGQIIKIRLYGKLKNM
ncbi:uncharacterized protein LOC123310062 [Coccinella septempunctata]|uniref:uncharacterized protein LOC123310062 n=1 Tax=Coccinella septempunctata TaxID=41139 RepID=UPI001D0989F5|nr:uncharacterized protein LOC123310062 [Coccinella septempunctata]